MNSKTFKINIKGVDQGKVSAIFATLNVIDSDGDVTLPGAFSPQSVVISSYGHASSLGIALPVGKGVIHADDKVATFEGEFFLDTEAGRDSFTTVKRLHESGLGEWSYGYEVLDYEHGTFDGRPVRFLKGLSVFEVSPVMRGAGVGTRTLAAKGASEVDVEREFLRFVKSNVETMGDAA